MALAKQSKPFIFAQGIDTKTAPEVTPVGSLHSAENVRFYQPGKLAKKRGSTLFPTTNEHIPGDSENNISQVNGAFTHLSALLAIGKNNISNSANSYVAGTPEILHLYSPTTQKWNFIGKAAFCIASSKQYANVDDFGANNLMQSGSSYTSSVIYNGLLYTINCISFGTNCYLAVIDLATQETLFRLRFSVHERPRVFQFGGKIYITQITNSGANLIATVIDPSLGLNILGTTVTFAMDLDATKKLYDLFVGANNRVYLAYANNSSTITVNSYTSLPTTGSASAANTMNIAEAPTRCLTIFGADATVNQVYTVFNTATPTLRINSATLTLTSVSTISLDTVEYAAVTGGSTVDASGNYLFLIGQKYNGGTITSSSLIAWAVNSSGSSLITPSLNQPSNLVLVSKAMVYNGYTYVITANVDPEELTYYLCVLTHRITSSGTDQNSNFVPVAKLLFAEGASPTSIGQSVACLPDLLNDGNGKLISVQNKFTYLNTAGTRFCVPTILTFDFQSVLKYAFRELAGNTYFNGGIPMVYDGQSLFEASFIHSPYQPSAHQTSVGNLTALGAYQFCTVFQFIDTIGNRHLSAPSIPTDTLTLTGTNTGASVTVYPPSLSYHLRVNVLLYRTEANGEIFYLDQIATLPCNGQSLNLTPSLTDSQLITQEILYTTGGVIENQCPVSARALEVWKDRVWWLTDNGIEFSKNVTDGFPVESNPLFNINATVNKSKPVAIGALRDKLLVFFQDDIYYTYGDGPNELGTGQFAPLELAISGVGCIAANAAISTQDLVFFLSRDGWRSINSALQVQYIGADVQQYFNENTKIKYATFCDSLHEFRVSDGVRTYCYDTFLKQWFTNTKWADVGGLLWTGINSGDKKFVRLRGSDNKLLYEDSGTWLDDGVFAPLLVRTGWISLDQFQGFERLYEIAVLGRYYSPHNLVVNLYYNDVPQIAETFTFSSASGNFAQFTDDQIFGSDTYAGGGNPMLLKVKPALQKCQSVRIEVFDQFVSGSGQSMELVGLNLILGVKGAVAKIRDAATVTGTGRSISSP